MSLLKRGDYWHYDFWEGGQRYQGSTRRKVKREAEKVELAERQKVLDRTQLGTLEHTSLHEAAYGWLEARGSKLRDAVNNESRVRLLVGPQGPTNGEDVATPWLTPSKPLDSLTKADLGIMVDRMIASGLSGATCNRYLALVQSIVAHASSRGKAAPVLQLKGIRHKEVPKERDLSDAEVIAVIHNLEPGGDPARVDQYDLAILLLETGARYSEVAQMHWTDYEMVGGRPALRFHKTKTDRPRVVAIGPRAVEVMERRKAARGPREVYVFPGKDEGPRGYATTGIQAAIDKAGCNSPELVARYGKATPHTFRHTHAAKLLRMGIPIHHVSSRLGHASIALTQRVYGHIKSSDGDEAILKLLSSQPIVNL